MNNMNNFAGETGFAPIPEEEALIAFEAIYVTSLVET